MSPAIFSAILDAMLATTWPLARQIPTTPVATGILDVGFHIIYDSMIIFVHIYILKS
jgi:hypothetical protein